MCFAVTVVLSVWRVEAERPGRESKEDLMPKYIGWHGTFETRTETLRRSQLPKYTLSRGQGSQLPKYTFSRGQGRRLIVRTATIFVVDVAGREVEIVREGSSFGNHRYDSLVNGIFV